MPAIARPNTGDFHKYFSLYIDQVPGEDVLAQIEAGGAEAVALLRGLSEEKAAFRYAPGKWSIKELYGHLIDSERLFAFRCLWFARGDEKAQPGMDENAWAEISNAHERSIEDLAAEYEAVRASTLCLLRSLDDAALGRSGNASGNTMSVQALPWLIAGHEIHHLKVLRERYLD